MSISKRLNYTIEILRAFLPAIFLLGLLSACDKSSIIGLDVQPANDKIQLSYEDSSTVISYTQKRDSVLTDGITLNLLGSYNDPVFGTSKASIYTQFNLPSNNVSLGTQDSLVADSLILALVYDPEYYGTLEQQTVKVYELTEAMSTDELYYSNRVISSGATAIGSLTFVPAPTDSVPVGTGKEKAQLRINLNGSDLKDRIVAASGTTDLVNTENFQSFFKGLYIVPENGAQAAGTGAILSFKLSDALSKMTLYYRDIAPSKMEAKTFNIEIGTASSRFTRFEHDYTGTAIESQLNDASLGQQWTYVQSMSGVRTKIEFPHIKNWLDSGAVSVNKAEFVIKFDPASIGNYYPPTNLVLTGIDSLGTSIFIPDQFEGEKYYGGLYDNVNNEYKINIARYIQQVLEDKIENNGLYLLPVASSIKGNRLVMGGPSNTTYTMQLRLTLTKVQ